MRKQKRHQEKSVTLSSDEKNLLETYNKFRIKSNTEVPEEEYVFKVDGVGCMPLGDLSAVKAPPKQGKTTAIKRIVATVLKGELGQLSSDLRNPLIMWVDTEQKVGDAKLIIQDIKKMTNLRYKYLDKHLMVYSMRKTDDKSMLVQMRAAIKNYQPHVVVLDGIAEFVNSVNDEVEAKDLIHQLMISAEEYYCAIICLIHENRMGNRDMNGHLGSQLAKKAAVVFECQKKGDIITVHCTDSRHLSTPSWSIRFDEQGHIVDTDDHISSIGKNARPTHRSNKKQQADAQRTLDVMKAIIQEHGGIKRPELVKAMKLQLNMARTPAYNYIASQLKNGTILEVSGLIQVNSQTLANAS